MATYDEVRGEVIKNLRGRYFVHSYYDADDCKECKTEYPATQCLCGAYQLEWKAKSTAVPVS